MYDDRSGGNEGIAVTPNVLRAGLSGLGGRGIMRFLGALGACEFISNLKKNIQANLELQVEERIERTLSTVVKIVVD